MDATPARGEVPLSSRLSSMLRSCVHRNNLKGENECQRQRKSAHDRGDSISGRRKEDICKPHRSHERQVSHNQPLKSFFGGSRSLQIRYFFDGFPDPKKEESPVIESVQPI